MTIPIAISDELLCSDRGLLRPCGLVAAAALAFNVWASDTARAIDAPAPASPQISIEDLSATRDRPLFSPSRRPRANNVAVAAPPPPPEPVALPSPPPNLTFFGTYESPTEVGAAVQVPPNDKPIIVRYGTIIDGWRVVDIKHHQLVLSQRDRTAVFTLFNPTAPSSGGAPGAASSASQFHPAPSITPMPAPGSTTPR